MGGARFFLLSIIGDSCTNCTLCRANHNVNVTCGSKAWDAGPSPHPLQYWPPFNPLTTLTAGSCVWAQGGRRFTKRHHHTQTRARARTRSKHGSCRQIDSNTDKQPDTHHITNGGDVSDSHLVYSVPLTAIFIKIRGRRRRENKLIRSRSWRPDCNPERQRATAATQSTMRAPARSWGSACAQRRLGFIVTHILIHSRAEKRRHMSGRRTDQVPGSRLLATARKLAAREHQEAPPTFCKFQNWLAQIYSV